MTGVRLIADDLTGALDAAIAFVEAGRGVPVYWGGVPVLEAAGSLAVDSATREAGPEEARRKVAELARAMPRGDGAICFAKLDSLLRGQAAAEIAGWIEAFAPDRCIVAPAFPHHGRITRGGLQYLHTEAGERAVGASLAAGLRAEGVPVRLCRPGDAAPAGVSLWDAESDEDLASVVEVGRACEGVTLWCGSGGLAAALTQGPGQAAIDPAALPRPILGLFGTDHPVTRAQLAACGDAVLALADGGRASAASLSAKLSAEGAALACLSLPEGLARTEAAGRIGSEFARLAEVLDAPGTLVVAGGETLRGLCLALGADHLDLYGQIEAGVPCSVLRGGRFDGVHVVSKSGAFGAPSLLRRLIFPVQGDHT